MPSLIDLRRRIRAVKSTEQITKAMKTVAASKLRRAQERIVGARPYARLMQRVLSDLATRLGDAGAHPLLAPPVAPDAPILLFVVTADKGLCGSFNSNLVRQAGASSSTPAARWRWGWSDARGATSSRTGASTSRFEMINLFNDLRYAHAAKVAEAAIEEYTAGKVSRVSVLYNEFKSVMQQEVVVDQVLPIPTLDDSDEEAEDAVPADYLFEPPAERIFGDLLPLHVETQIFHALLESAAAEHAARMTAMDAATRNAGEMIDGLTLHMNKVRQAGITRELIEVVSGAEAL